MLVDSGRPKAELRNWAGVVVSEGFRYLEFPRYILLDVSENMCFCRKCRGICTTDDSHTGHIRLASGFFLFVVKRSADCTLAARIERRHLHANPIILLDECGSLMWLILISQFFKWYCFLRFCKSFAFFTALLRSIHADLYIRLFVFFPLFVCGNSEMIKKYVYNQHKFRENESSLNSSNTYQHIFNYRSKDV